MLPKDDHSVADAPSASEFRAAAKVARWQADIFERVRSDTPLWIRPFKRFGFFMRALVYCSAGWDFEADVIERRATHFKRAELPPKT